MAAIDPSLYRKIELVKDGKSVDIRLACAAIDIYESVLSPNITAKIQIVNAGGSIKDDKGDIVTLYEGMKVRGGEQVFILIDKNAPQNKAVDFLNTHPLYVSSIENVIKDDTKEFFVMNLVSREAFENQHTFLLRSFSKEAKISKHVEDILNESFRVSRQNVLDPTSNTLGFNGNQEKPFDMLINLASKSVSGDAISKDVSAGFFFFQTIRGFNFRSIDKLMTEEKKATFVYTDSNINRIDYRGTEELPNLDFKITYFEIKKNQNFVKQLRRGAYATSRRFFDPTNYRVTDESLNFKGDAYIGPMKNLGQPFDTNDLSYDGIDLTTLPSQIITDAFDRGTLDKGVTEEPTYNIEEVLSQRKVRYNTLYTQVANLQVPLATHLQAGDIVEILFPKVNAEEKYDLDSPQVSGLYMITDLRHHFDSRYSMTSMNIARDTFGKTGINNRLS